MILYAVGLTPSLIGKFRTIQQSILQELASTSDGICVNPKTSPLPPLAAFFTLALVRTARSFASVRRGSNPTWIRPGGKPYEYSRASFEKAWLKDIDIMGNDLIAAHSPISYRAWAGTVGLANSKTLPIEDNSIDLIVTSPPYCTRIDYVISSSFELAALGIGAHSVDQRALRQQAMGTTLSRSKKTPKIPEYWPDPVRELLISISKHFSKASSSYYAKTYIQYFEDAIASLEEVARVLRPGAVSILVVQSSYYKDIYVDLPGLYVSCAEFLGLRSQVACRFEVKRALAQINSKSRQYQTTKNYEEVIVVIEKAL